MKALRRTSIVVLGTATLAGNVSMLGQRSTPTVARGPAHGDGGVSAFYVWDEAVPG